MSISLALCTTANTAPTARAALTARIWHTTKSNRRRRNLAVTSVTLPPCLALRDPCVHSSLLSLQALLALTSALHRSSILLVFRAMDLPLQMQSTLPTSFSPHSGSHSWNSRRTHTNLRSLCSTPRYSLSRSLPSSSSRQPPSPPISLHSIPPASSRPLIARPFPSRSSPPSSPSFTVQIFQTFSPDSPIPSSISSHGSPTASATSPFPSSLPSFSGSSVQSPFSTSGAPHLAT